MLRVDFETMVAELAVARADDVPTCVGCSANHWTNLNYCRELRGVGLCQKQLWWEYQRQRLEVLRSWPVQPDETRQDEDVVDVMA